MSTTQIMIVEDEALIADHLAVCLEDCGYQIAGIADSAEEALQLLQNKKPDLILIDINLSGDLDGVDLAQSINVQHQIPFIFVTSNSDSRTLARVKLTRPAGFILKPYQIEDIRANVGIALYKQHSLSPKSSPNSGNQNVEDGFFVREKHALQKIRYEEILYAEALDNYTRLVTEKGRHVLSSTLKNIENQLEPLGFLRVHRSYLVNLQYIEQILPKSLRIGEAEIPVSESNRSRLLKRIRTL